MPAAAGQRLDRSLPTCGRIHPVSSLLPVEVQRRGLLSRAYDRLSKTVLGFPDHYAPWLVPCIVTGMRLMRRSMPDVIIATAPPFTALLAGAVLARRGGVPLILDYRDPWTVFDWPPTPQNIRKTSSGRKRLERWILARATGAVFTSGLMRRQFERHYEARGAPWRAVITNGHLPAAVTPTRQDDGRTLRMVYAGNFYGERRLCTVIAALGRIESDGSNVQAIEVHVYGQIGDDDWQQTVATGHSDRVKRHVPVSHQEILQIMADADILLLASGGDMAYSYPYKLFDYLSVRRPILAISPAGSALEEFMRSSDCGEVASVDEPGEVARALSRLLARRSDYSYRGCDGYTWDRLAQRYEDLLYEVVARDSIPGQVS